MSSPLCLIGHPLGHSLSPFIHTRLFALAGRDGTYTLCDIAPDNFGYEIPAVLRAVGGCNVTIPYKQAIVPFLDRVEGKAALYQTVNTVAVTADGVIGYNTDADGFLCALREADILLSGRVLVLGAGGAGTVIGFEAASAGCEVLLYNRTHKTAETLCNHIRNTVPDADCTAVDKFPDGTIDLLINTTSVGMYPHTDACPVPDEVIARCKAVFDVIYNPRQTVLLQKAEANGAKTAGGMAMLVWQAAIAHQHWFGTAFDPADIARLIDDCYDELAARF